MVGPTGQAAQLGGGVADGGAAASDAVSACLEAVGDPCAAAGDPCAAAGDPCAAAGSAAGSSADRPDLTWLLHRAAQHMRAGLDQAAQAHGLAGARDWIVLSALAAGPRQTQLALAQSLGLDKTTMTSLLDRMEGRGLIVRRPDRHDRRARIPELTADGRRVQAEVTGARDQVEAGLLSGFSADEQAQLRDLLTRLTVAPTAHGSCI
jgi:MarR family transcriptional regulator, organic hydroperoxide resistance regulator